MRQEAIKKGRCPNHPDVILKTGLIFKKTKECPRCKDEYEFKMKKQQAEMEQMQLQQAQQVAEAAGKVAPALKVANE